MADGLKFDLVSPERLLVSEVVESVVVPGTEGYLTVMAHHAPLMTTLKPGVVEVKDQAGNTRRVFVRGGLADINAAGLTILADQAVNVEEMSPDFLSEQIRLAEQEVEAAGVDPMRLTAANKRLSDIHDVQRWILPA